MFSIIFLVEGSQIVGMARDFYNYKYVKEYFSNADDILQKKISKIIFEGPKESLDKTENTQPAIFLVSYSIFKVIEKRQILKLVTQSFLQVILLVNILHYVAPGQLILIKP